MSVSGLLPTRPAVPEWKHFTTLDVAKGSRLSLGFDLDAIFRVVGLSQARGQ
jgi:hypothetical protein